MRFNWRFWRRQEQPAAKPEWLQHLVRIEAKEGDVFVLLYSQHNISDEARDRIAAAWSEHMNGAKCIVLDGGAQLGVINAAALTQAKESRNA